MDLRIDILLQLLDQAFDRRAWHGTNLRGSIRGLTVAEALWRPHPRRHNIWEIVLHTAYWKYSVRRHLTGEPPGSFPRDGSDWPRLPEPANAAAWKRDVALLRDQHLCLRAAVAACPAVRLATFPKGLKWRVEQYIYGAASHDLYHAGQIQLLKRLQRGG